MENKSTKIKYQQIVFIRLDSTTTIYHFKSGWEEIVNGNSSKNEIDQ